MWTRDVIPLSRPKIDYLSVRAPGEPLRNGFIMDERGCWRRKGWRAAETRDAGGAPHTTAQVDARMWRDGTADRWCQDCEVTRLDICRDFQDAPISLDLVEYMSGHRGTVGTMASDGGRSITVYVGSRRSPVMLRMYCKSYKGKPPPTWLEREWGAQWDERPVTRVEFELKGKALLIVGADRERALARQIRVEDLSQRTIDSLWRDAATRYRMRASRVSNYAEANKVPEAEGWRIVRGCEPGKNERAKLADSLYGWERKLARLLRRYREAGFDVDAIVQASSEIPLEESDNAAIKRLERRRGKLELDAWRLNRDAEAAATGSEPDEEDEE